MNDHVLERNNGVVPRDFMGWILLFFVIGALTLTGYGQLRTIGVLMAGSFTAFFLITKRFIPKEMLILLAWTLWAGSTGYIVSFDKEAFMDSYKVIIQILVMSFAISGITAKQRSINILFTGLLTGGVILFFNSVLTGELMQAIDTAAQIQVKGLTDNPNDYGYSLLLCASGLLYFWGTSKSKAKKSLIIVMFFLFTVGIVFSASRKAFVGVIALAILWQLFCYGKRILKKPSLLLSLMGIVIIFFFISDYMLSKTYMGTRFEKDFVEKEVQINPEENKRVILYQEGFRFIADNLLFGIGLGNFTVLSVLEKESHSDYIEVTASTGIVGAAMYFSIYIFLWIRLNTLQKIIRDRDTLYKLGLIKAIIITILLTATGRPNLASQTTWIILSAFIGYTAALENRVHWFNRIKRIGMNE